MFGQKFFPYSTLQELNLDWILTKVKNILRFVPDDGAVGQILRRTKDGAEWSNETGGGGAVDSVNGQTGTVVLTASDVGALPDTYTPTFPVTSVNNKTGAVVLSKSDIGLSNVANVLQYSHSNPPPYPVTSVNGQTGAVVIAPVTPTVIVDNTSYVNGTVYENTKTYTVTGDGVILVSASAYSDTQNDFGMWQAEIYHNNTLIFGEGTRFATSYNRRWGASASCPIQVSNGDTIKIYLYNSKTGTISVFRRFMCFGCTVS